MRSDEGLAVIFALRSDYPLTYLADRFLKLANLSEKAVESVHFMRFVIALLARSMNLCIMAD